MLQFSRWAQATLIGFFACSTAAQLFAKAPVPSLEGRWQIGYSNPEIAGEYYYIFKGNTLTIELWKGGKDGAAPNVSYERFTFALEATKSPNRLVLTTIPKEGVTPATRTKWIHIDEDGRWVWLTRENGEDWEIGLQRIK